MGGITLFRVAPMLHVYLKYHLASVIILMVGVSKTLILQNRLSYVHHRIANAQYLVQL